MSSTPYQANLTSTFDDTYTPSPVADGGELDGSAIYRRMQRPSKKPAWIAPVAGVVIIAAGAAVFLIQPKDEPVVPNIASAQTPQTTRTASLTPAEAALADAALPAGETVSVSTSAPAPAPLRTARTAPVSRPAAIPAETQADTESLTSAPAADEPAPAPAPAQTPAPVQAAPAVAPEPIPAQSTPATPGPSVTAPAVEEPTTTPATPAESASPAIPAEAAPAEVNPAESQPTSDLPPVAAPVPAPAQGDALAPAAVNPVQ